MSLKDFSDDEIIKEFQKRKLATENRKKTSNLGPLVKYTDREIIDEYWNRESKIEEEKKDKEHKLKTESRTKWLKENGGLEGGDICKTKDCRIDCYMCDSNW